MLFSSKTKAMIIQKMELVVTLTIAQIKSRYRKTYAGFAWVLLSPIITFTVQALIFKNILKVQMNNYYLYLLAGIIPWIFVTSSLNMTVNTFISSRSVLMAFKLDPWVLLISQIFDNLINFIASFLILLFLSNKFLIFQGWTFPLFILTVIVFSLFVFFLSFFLSVLQIFMRDTQFILQFALNLTYFVTPIFYPRELLPANIGWIVDINPFYIFIKPFQHLFWKYDLNLYFHSMITAVMCLIVLIFISLSFWRMKKDAIYFRI